MSSEMPLVVNLEVTVPRIIVATGVPHLNSTNRATRAQGTADRQSEDEEEQVRFVPLVQHEAASVQPHSALRQMVVETSLRIAHTVRFRMFRIQVPAQSQSFLVHVFRWRTWFTSEEKRKATDINHDLLYLSDKMTLSLEYRAVAESGRASAESPLTTPLPNVIPGINKVVIYLNSEGVPGSYSIDGAES